MRTLGFCALASCLLSAPVWARFCEPLDKIELKELAKVFPESLVANRGARPYLQEAVSNLALGKNPEDVRVIPPGKKIPQRGQFSAVVWEDGSSTGDEIKSTATTLGKRVAPSGLLVVENLEEMDTHKRAQWIAALGPLEFYEVDFVPPSGSTKTWTLVGRKAF